MSAFEIQYADEFGDHAEAVEGWDREDAVHNWKAQHSGDSVALQDVILLGNVEELEVAA